MNHQTFVPIRSDAPRALVIFAGWHGQTEIIARKLGLLAQRRGYFSETLSADEAGHRTDVATFDHIVVCAGVHMKKHHREARHFIASHLDTLAARRSSFVSVSLSAAALAGDDRSSIEKVVDDYLRNTHWMPANVLLVGGALHYTRYGWLTRWMMRRNSERQGGPVDTTRDYELTDWPRLERDADSVFPSESTHTADQLDIGSATLYRKLKRYAASSSSA